ncbi:MAG TPA: DUF6798 domain-containing protein [Bryobacteraceae bacterium]|nr:DUF6798 domain-containing protein [Bryobacteraceae bacterium]
MRALGLGAAAVLITLLGFFLFPGHTYLQSDTQIYIPMLERLNNPALFARDIVALRPHLGLTIYDETALSLKRLIHTDLQWILQAEQLVFRALAVCGLMLIALRCGLSGLQAFFVAAVVSLGATINGAAVLTLEYEPVPRGFAISLLVFALGLIAQESYIAAGIAAGAAFLYHAPTTIPFWGLAFLLAVAKRLRWTVFAPLAIAAALLAILTRLQPPGVEAASLMRRLDPFQETMQRLRTSYDFVSTWILNVRIGYVVQALLCAVAFWRVRKIVPQPLRDFLWGLPLMGIVSVPVSFVLLENQHWALVPAWQPARAILFVSLIAALLASIAAIRATSFLERALWLTAAFLMPMQHAMVGRTIDPKPLYFAAALAIVTAALSVVRKEALPVAAILAFWAIPQSKLVENYPRIETSELRAVADWARTSTPEQALFLFPDSGTNLAPGIFRARALRGLYVDWKSGGQVNYFPEFSREWWRRWVETGNGRWSTTPDDFPRLNAMGVDYVALKKPIPGAAPLFHNDAYSVYATSSRDSR